MCKLKALVSFDPRTEQIVGRGVTTSCQAKASFAILKSVIRGYMRHRAKLAMVYCTTKRRFYGEFRIYCRELLQKHSNNWATVFWAGYPLYQIPSNSVQDSKYLFKMNFVTVKKISGARNCTFSHKQLHDLVNKQFQKITQQLTPTTKPRFVDFNNESLHTQYENLSRSYTLPAVTSGVRMYPFSAISPAPLEQRMGTILFTLPLLIRHPSYHRWQQDTCWKRVSSEGSKTEQGISTPSQCF
uniref:Uncharacterized protein n=1 Tax=Aplanochytrium stocchinoi TaxID=215587 RepID=A0A7S3LLA5_9STRA|mmetsp:Transcript_18256/g.22516  ORF Transcript_18256/g.22516 Transcript_18256/m.22516 type:complete len:242 (+) Transcript_18256:170-895(+)